MTETIDHMTISPASMPTLLHFLQNAHFPAPPTVIKETANSTDVSDVDIGLVEDAWKARFAI